MDTFGSDQRALFETRAMALYEHTVTHAGLRPSDPRIAKDGSDHEAFELLTALGLLSLDPATGHYLAVDPAAVQSRVVAPMGQQGAELLAESGHWARAFGSLASTWRRFPQATEGPVTELRGDAIESFLVAAVADAEIEILTAQPQAKRRASRLPAALVRDLKALERGVKLRTLYQHSSRRSAVTHKYVRSVSARGAEVRTLDEFFNRLIVIDRKVAVIPSHLGVEVAVVVREPSVVAYLVDMFERTFERARPYANKEPRMMKDIAREQRAITIRMLIEGYPDPKSAQRLGVSPRTYAGYIADLKEDYDAQSRFQLGYLMGQQGISGNEPLEDDSSTALG
ncbi:MAG: LuxR family transcriptional regulator [Nocardioides sp.]